MAWLAFGLIALFVACGTGLVFAAGAGVIVAMMLGGQDMLLNFLPTRLMAKIDVYVLLSLPMFILAGEIMNRSGVTRVLIELGFCLVGWMRGGLAQVNILASIFLAGISGSSIADAVAMSKTLVPEMVRRGYTVEYATAVTAASSVIGPIIPPSIIMIIYGALFDVSIAALFIAGIVPGLIIAAGLMGTNWVIAIREGHPGGKDVELPPFLPTLIKALPALVLPAIVIGGIVFGVVTPTEAGALACVAAILCGLLYRQFRLRDFRESLEATAVLVGPIFLIIGTLSFFSWYLALEHVPRDIAAWVADFGFTGMRILILTFVVFAVFGALADLQTCLYLIAPVLVPIAIAQGVDPVHMGVVTIINFVLGGVSPPNGGLLLISSSVTGASYWPLCRAVMPLFLVQLFLLFVMLFLPELSLWLPRLMGLVA